MTESTSCTYVLCQACYSEAADKEVRCRRNKTKIVNKEKCDASDHKVAQLLVWNDDGYFKHDYRQTLEYPQNLATVCAKCARNIMRD